MTIRSFSLKHFPSDPPASDFQIAGSIEWHSHILSFSYTLLGPVAELALPAPAEQPSRKKSLWEETCFEVFLGVKNSPRYWEFNISPAGHWNVYRFNAYRQGMEEEPSITSLPMNIDRRSEALRLSVRIGLEHIFPGDQSLEAAVSAVIKTIQGTMTCWALVHPGQRADFHRRDSFIIDL